MASVTLLKADVNVHQDTKTVEVSRYRTDHPEIYGYFQDVPQDLLSTRFDHVVLVGALALKSVGTTEKIDYIEKHFAAFQSEFEQKIREYLGEEGRLSRLMDTYFGERGSVPEFINAFFGDDGKIAKELLDPSRGDSPLGKLKREMIEEFVRLRKDLGIHEAEKVLVARTPIKGESFEDELEEMLGKIVRPFSDKLERTTKTPGLLKKNKKGDFVVTLGQRPDLRLTIEAKDTKGLSFPKIERTMEEAIENRGAGYGILVARDVENLPDSVGWFGEYKGKRSFLVVALGSRDADDHRYFEMLEVAYRWARNRLLMHRAELAGIDTTAIQKGLEKADRAIKRFRNIRTHCTNAEKAVDAIRKEVEGIQADLNETFDRIANEIASAATE